MYLGNLVGVYHRLGRTEEAMAACLAAMQHAKDGESSSSIVWIRLEYARLLLERGETAHALSHSTEIADSLGAVWESEATWLVVDALELTAALLVTGHQPECAARLLGAASALRAAMPRPVSVGESAMLARDREAITAILGEPVFTQAWAVGQEQSLARTVAEARTALAALAR